MGVDHQKNGGFNLQPRRTRMTFIQFLESKDINNKGLLSKFNIESLGKGQGITIGNALRRTMLSDISGIAIAGVRISNINHEFSIIPGVREDVIEILLNLKQIVLKGTLKEPAIIRLNFQGPGIITAADIELTGNLTFVDPQQYIATVNIFTTIEIEFFIQQGQGYSLSGTIDSVPPDFIPVDAVFMPVRKVNFFVETSKNKPSGEEDLILEVQTDGSITPLQAIKEAAQVLKDKFNSLSVKDSVTQTLIIDEPIVKDQQPNVKNTLIEELELSVRAYNCLKRANIHTIGELLNYSQEELLEFKNFGQKSANEVCENLKKRFNLVIRFKKGDKSPIEETRNEIFPLYNNKNKT